MAWHAGIITLVGTLLIFAITKWLISSTNQTESIDTVAPKIYGIRKNYFLLLITVIIIALFGTLQGLPYFPPTGETPDYTVKVTGQMFGWEMGTLHNTSDQSEADAIESGKLVEFVISSKDVNHGMGIYNAAGDIVTQTQAMPGYDSKLYYRFDQPGTYHIVCMEYCGVGHPVMTSQLQVQ